MKNKLIIITAVIGVSILISFLYSLVVMPPSKDMLKEFTNTVLVEDNRAVQDFNLSGGAYLLKVKNRSRDASRMEIFVNGKRVSPNVPPYILERKGSEKRYIRLSKEDVKEGSNTFEVIFTGDYTESVVMSVSNYRKKIDSNIYVLFADSEVFAARQMSFSITLQIMIIISFLFFIMGSVLNKIFFLNRNKIFLIHIYSLAPFFVFLVCLGAVNKFNAEYNVVISKYYFWLSGAASFLIIESCVISRELFRYYNSIGILGLLILRKLFQGVELLIRLGILIVEKPLHAIERLISNITNTPSTLQKNLILKKLSNIAKVLSTLQKNLILKNSSALHKLEQFQKTKTREIRNHILIIKPQVLKFIIKISNWFRAREVADRYILLFTSLLSICGFFIILNLESVAEQFANIAYFALLIGVIIRFIKLIEEEKKN